MTKARDILNASYNKEESKYGSTRSTLFGKFYERILVKWFEKKRYCRAVGWPGKRQVHKPRIYWKNLSVEGFDFSGAEELKQQMADSLKNKVSHCTPDGVFEKDGKFYIWEAKNWPLYPEKGPRQQILAYLANYPWILARTFDLSRSKYAVSGFWFSYWCNKPDDEREIEEVERTVSTIVGEGRFEIILTDRVLDDCIANQYPWYIEVVEQERANVAHFFEQLLGRE